VFNCDSELDVRAMGRIFIGLLRCGAWGCFDEFNRLGEDVLSAVSTQVQAIQVRSACVDRMAQGFDAGWRASGSSKPT
jgi:hypothetical protein